MSRVRVLGEKHLNNLSISYQEIGDEEKAMELREKYYIAKMGNIL